MNPASVRATKRERVLRVLDEVEADATVLRSAAAVNWYLDGARSHVSLAADPIVRVLVDRRGDVAIVTSNEQDRLRDEELPPDVELASCDWHGSLDSVEAGLRRDRDSGRFVEESVIEARLRAERTRLLPHEADRFRALGSDVARAMTDTLTVATPDETERAVAARVTAALTAEGVDSLVVLVGGANRGAYRHPVPTAAALGRRAMLVVCGRRHGLIANATRWVTFEPPTSGERAADAAILRVESAFFTATVDGAELRSVLAAGAQAYARHGFDPHEWRRHHQGGIAGYHGRDPRATPSTTDIVRPRQAFAWNPSGKGAKVEDTVYWDGARMEALTQDPRWPTEIVDGRTRPAVLRR